MHNKDTLLCPNQPQEIELSTPSLRLQAILSVFITVFFAACMPKAEPTITWDDSTPTVLFEPTRLIPTSAPVVSTTATASATLLPSPVKPSATPTAKILPTNTPTLVLPKGVSESVVTFKAYPFDKAIHASQDPVNHFTFNAFDRSAYEAALAINPPVSKTFRSIIMENEFLRLTFLPELGGRLFQITYKPTKQNLFYNNQVLKPTNWGPSNQGGWLAVGGMEWALPVNEHGYEWGIRWDYSFPRNSTCTTILFTDTQSNDRVRAEIQVTLPSNAAYIIVHPKIYNPTKVQMPIQFWINAQISLGESRNVSPNTEFILPANPMFVHSTGNQFIPSKLIPTNNARSTAEPVDWPIISERDMSWYSNWEDYLGLFVTTSPKDSFVGAYNHDTNLGLVRVFPPKEAPGVKLFAFGPNFCCRAQISDDGSDYFELWGGLPRTFFPQDDVTLDPGKTREWDEYWIPFSRTGGLSFASSEIVLFVKNDNGKARIGAYSPNIIKGTLVLVQGNEEIKLPVTLGPTTPFSTTRSVSQGKINLKFLDSQGRVVANAP